MTISTCQGINKKPIRSIRAGNNPRLLLFLCVLALFASFAVPVGATTYYIHGKETDGGSNSYNGLSPNPNGSVVTIEGENFNSGTLGSSIQLRHPEIHVGSETVTAIEGSPPTTYVKDTDYTIDYGLGRITCLTGSMAADTNYKINYTITGKPFKTIQYAVTKAKSGDVVKVVPHDYAAGPNTRTIYYENVVVTKNITLDIDTSGLDSSDLPDQGGPPLAWWVIIDGDCDYNGDGDCDGDDAVHSGNLNSTDTTGDKVGDNGNATIAWNGGVGGTLRNFEIRGGYSHTPGGFGAGVFVGGEETNVSLTGLRVFFNDNGIAIRYGAAPVITGNRIQLNDRSGIIVRDGSSPVIGGGEDWNSSEKNIITANGQTMSDTDCPDSPLDIDCDTESDPKCVCEQERAAGCAAIAVLDGSAPTISGNAVYDNKFIGIMAKDQSSPAIIKNEISGHTRVGLGLFAASQAITITGNKITANKRGIGIQSSGDPCNKIAIKDNDITGNVFKGISTCNAYVQIGGVSEIIAADNLVDQSSLPNPNNQVRLGSKADTACGGGSECNDYYAGMKLYAASGTPAWTTIIDYNGTSKIATVIPPYSVHPDPDDPENATYTVTKSEGNRINDNGGTGIFLAYYSNAEINYNNIVDNLSKGITVFNSTAIIEKNLIASNGYRRHEGNPPKETGQIEIWSGTAERINNNLIAGNYYYAGDRGIPPGGDKFPAEKDKAFAGIGISAREAINVPDQRRSQLKEVRDNIIYRVGLGIQFRERLGGNYGTVTKYRPGSVDRNLVTQWGNMKLDNWNDDDLDIDGIEDGYRWIGPNGQIASKQPGEHTYYYGQNSGNYSYKIDSTIYSTIYSYHLFADPDHLTDTNITSCHNEVSAKCPDFKLVENVNSPVYSLSAYANNPPANYLGLPADFKYIEETNGTNTYTGIFGNQTNLNNNQVKLGKTASSKNNYYNGMTLVTYGSAEPFEMVITDYAGSDRVATLAQDYSIRPAEGENYVIKDNFGYNFRDTVEDGIVPPVDGPPVVARTIPENGADEVSRKQAIIVYLQDHESGVDEDLVSLTLKIGETIVSDCTICSTSGTSSHLKVTYKPATLSQNTTYTVEVTATDLLGNELADGGIYSFSFTTTSVDLDNTGPEILGDDKPLTPLDGATFVLLDSPIQFELRDHGHDSTGPASGIDPDTIILSIINDTDGTSETPPLSKTAIAIEGNINPDYLVYYKPEEGALKRDKTYTLQIEADDYAGNSLYSTSSFSTIPWNDGTAPADITQLKAQVRGTNNVKLTWLPSENTDCDIASYPYTLYYSPSGLDYGNEQALSSLPYYEGDWTVFGVGEGVWDFKITVTDLGGAQSAGTEVKNVRIATSHKFEDDLNGFYDDFSSGLGKFNSEGASWEIVNDGSNDELRVSGSAGELTIDGLNRSDYNYWADITIETTQPDDAAWLLVRKTPGSDIGAEGYAVKIGRGTTDNISIYELPNTELTSYNYEINSNTTYNIKLTLEGNAIKLTIINDGFTRTVVDTDCTYWEGQIGLLQPADSNAIVRYDNIKVNYNKNGSGIYRYTATSNDWSHTPDTTKDDSPPRLSPSYLDVSTGSSNASELLIEPLALADSFVYTVKFNITSGSAGVVVNKVYDSPEGSTGYRVEVSPGLSNNVKFYKLSDSDDELKDSGSTPSSIDTGTEHTLWVIKRDGEYEVRVDDATILSSINDTKYAENTVAGLYAPASSQVAYDDISISDNLSHLGGDITIPGSYNYAQIQAAIDNANDGDTITFSAGTTYNLADNTIKLKDGVHLEGPPGGNPEDPCSSKTVTIKGTGNWLIDAHLTGNAASVKGFRLEGNTSNVGIRIIGVSPTITNNEIVSCYDGIRVSTTEDNTTAAPEISKNCIHNNTRYGIANSIESQANILNNNIYNNSKYGIGNQNSSAPRIEGNDIYNNAESGIGNRGSSRAAITNNTIYSNGYQGIAVQSKANPKIWNNEIRDNLDGIGLKGEATSTITNNNIYSNLRNGIGVQEYANATIGGDSVIYSNTLRNNYRGVAVQDDPTDPESHPHATVGYNQIYNNRGQGIACQGDLTVNILNNQIYSNIQDIAATDVSGVGFRDFSGTAVVDSNQIRHHSNNVHAFGIGISGDSSGNLTISNNTIQSNSCGGIGLIDNPSMQSITIIDNTITSNGSTTGAPEEILEGHSGIHVNNTANTTITNNTITSNANDGISVRNCSPFIGFEFTAPDYRRDNAWDESNLTNGNIIRNNKRAGIGVNGDTVGTEPRIRGNIIKDNSLRGIMIRNTHAKVFIYGNTIHGSATPGCSFPNGYNASCTYGVAIQDNAIVTMDNNYISSNIATATMQGAILSIVNGNLLPGGILGQDPDTKVHVLNSNYIHHVNFRGNSMIDIEDNNEITGGIDMKGSALLHLHGNNKVHNCKYGIEKQTGAGAIIWDGNEFYDNEVVHIRSHSGGIFIIGYENYNTDTKIYSGNHSPNLFHDATGWGIAPAAIEIKQGQITTIGNEFYDNPSVIRFGCCGGGLIEAIDNVFRDNQDGIVVSGKSVVTLTIHGNVFHNNLVRAIGLNSLVHNVGYYVGSIKDNTISSSGEAGIGFNSAYLYEDFYIEGNKIHHNKQGIGISENSLGFGHKIVIANNLIYSNDAAGISGQSSLLDLDINGNEISDNGLDPSVDPPNYRASGIMFRDYTGEINIHNNLIERHPDNGIQFQSASVVNMTISSNTIRYNGDTDDPDSEGGIRVQEGATGTIRGNKIYGNYDDGIAVRGTATYPVTVTISDNEIYSNGWDWANSTPTWNSLFNPHGIGVQDYANVIIERNKIYNNGNGPGHEMSAGIGFHITNPGTTPIVRNNFIFGHKHSGITTNNLAAGLFVYGNTIADNNYGLYRGDDNLDDESIYTPQPVIINTVIWSNTTASIGSDDGLTLNPIVTYSDIYTTTDPTYPGTGNIKADPIFFDSAANNYRLAFDSACRNAGINIAELANDFDQESRPINSITDIGADEMPRSSGIVSAIANDASGGGFGIQTGDQVIITFATGTNTPTINYENIDSVLALNGGRIWLNGSGAIGSVEWNTSKYDGDTLRITLSADPSAPTVAVGVTTTLTGTIITDRDGNPINNSSTITGSFGIERFPKDATSFWRFDEGTGFTVYDETDDSNYGTLYAPMWRNSGIYNNTLAFNNNPTWRINLPKTVIDGLTDLSVEFWAKTNYINDPIISDSLENEFLLHRQNNFAVYIKGSSWETGIDFNDGNWHHIAVVRTASAVHVYRDGEPQASTTSLPSGPLAIVSDDLTLGAAYYGSLDEIVFYDKSLTASEVNKRYLEYTTKMSTISAYDNSTEGTGIQTDDQVVITFNGQTNAPIIDASNIDVVLNLGVNNWVNGYGEINGAVWSDGPYSNDTLTITLSTAGGTPTVKAGNTITLDGNTITNKYGNPIISSGAIDGNFGGGAILTNPLAYWKFDHGSGKTLYDESTNSSDGMIYGTTWDNGINSDALNFSHHSHYVRLPNTAINGLTNVSVAFWAKTTGSSDGIVSGAAGPIPNDNEYLLFGQHNLRIVIKGTYWDTGIAFNDGDWHHIVVTRTNDKICAYKNGALQHSITTGLPSGPLAIAPDGFIIGQEQDAVGGGFDANQAYNGLLDELYIYDYELTTTEVAQNYLKYGAKMDSLTALDVSGTDQVVITFNTGTNAPIIDATNIDSVFDIGTHSWKDGDGEIDGAVWSDGPYSNDTLTITLSTAGSTPTVDPGDTVTLLGENIITNKFSYPVIGSGTIGGSF